MSVICPTNKVLEIFVHRARFFHPSFLEFFGRGNVPGKQITCTWSTRAKNKIHSYSHKMRPKAKVSESSRAKIKLKNFVTMKLHENASEAPIRIGSVHKYPYEVWYSEFGVCMCNISSVPLPESRETLTCTQLQLIHACTRLHRLYICICIQCHVRWSTTYSRCPAQNWCVICMCTCGFQ